MEARQADAAIQVFHSGFRRAYLLRLDLRGGGFLARRVCITSTQPLTPAVSQRIVPKNKVSSSGIGCDTCTTSPLIRAKKIARVLAAPQGVLLETRSLKFEQLAASNWQLARSRYLVLGIWYLVKRCDPLPMLSALGDIGSPWVELGQHWGMGRGTRLRTQAEGYETSETYANLGWPGLMWDEWGGVPLEVG
jgi:hypothetical protein